MFSFLFISFIGLSFDRLNIFKYCLISCCLHELGHILCYRFYTGYWPQINIKMFGFSMKNNVSLHKHYNKILFAGPFVNLISALYAATLCLFNFTINRYVFFTVNILIFIFNMLPVYYFDGGQILYTKSLFYRNNYKVISFLTLLLLCVMLFSFTCNAVIIFLPALYYIINISNDI